VGVYSPEGGGGAGSPRRCHGRARWLAGVGASVHYGLWLPAVPSSNQSGGQGVLTKGYSRRRRSPKLAHDGKASTLVLGNDRRELQGVESIGSSSNGCGITSASSSGSHHGPKHRRVVALCVGAAARV
jgi:hypothetical protein